MFLCVSFLSGRAARHNTVYFVGCPSPAGGGAPPSGLAARGRSPRSAARFGVVAMRAFVCARALAFLVCLAATLAGPPQGGPAKYKPTAVGAGVSGCSCRASARRGTCTRCTTHCPARLWRVRSFLGAAKRAPRPPQLLPARPGRRAAAFGTTPTCHATAQPHSGCRVACLCTLLPAGFGAPALKRTAGRYPSNPPTPRPPRGGGLGGLLSTAPHLVFHRPVI